MARINLKSGKFHGAGVTMRDLLHWRSKNQFTQEKAAKHFGVTRVTYLRWENGNTARIPLSPSALEDVPDDSALYAADQLLAEGMVGEVEATLKSMWSMAKGCDFSFMLSRWHDFRHHAEREWGSQDGVAPPRYPRAYARALSLWRQAEDLGIFAHIFARCDGGPSENPMLFKDWSARNRVARPQEPPPRFAHRMDRFTGAALEAYFKRFVRLEELTRAECALIGENYVKYRD